MKIRIILIAVLVCSLLGPAPATAFADLGDGHWAQDNIEILAAKDLVAGYADGTFRPDDALTRAEAVVLIVQAQGGGAGLRELQQVDCIFRDVPDGHWASAYINLAWERGLVSGYADGSFRPERIVDRYEFTAMLTRALSMREFVEEPTVFADAARIPDWVRRSVDLATSYGLVSGYPDGTFRGDESVLRGEATSMLAAYLREVGVYHDFYGSLESHAEGRVQIRVNDISYDMPLAQAERVRDEAARIAPESMVRGAFNQQGELILLEPVEPEDVPAATVVAKSGRDTSFSSEEPVEGARLGGDYLDRLYGPDDATRSAELVREALNLQDPQGGSGEIIAVIDSGLDPGLECLQKLPDGSEKLVGFYDVTGEGTIVREGSVAKTSRYVRIDEQQMDLQGVTTESGLLHYGWIDESRLAVDLDLNGRTDDRLAVLFADRAKAGRYDTIYVDTDQDLRFSDETPFSPYENGFERYNLNRSTARGDLYVVVSELAPDGSRAVLGFDANGHGTAMAAAAAGYGDVTGAAPGARLLAIKAFDASGRADWRDIEEAIRLAVKKGATVVNLSLGYEDRVTSGNNSLTYLAQKYNELYGVVFVGAAGNLGPGSSTLTTPGNGEGVLGVSGHLPANYADKLLGLPLDQDVILQGSSRGPRQDGYPGVDVSAPVMSVLPLPLWDERGQILVEGTSVASALASGVVANWLAADGAVPRTEKEQSFERMVRAAARIEDFETVYAGGAGQLDAQRLLRQSALPLDLDITTWNRELGVGKGLFGRDYTPGSLPVFVHSERETSELLYWESDASWMRPAGNLMVLPAGATRTLPLDFSVPTEPGLYSAQLRLHVLPALRQVSRMEVGVVVPWRMEDTQDGRTALDLEGAVQPGATQRFFVQVEPGSRNLQATVFARRRDASYWFYDPDGRRTARNDLTSGSIGTVHVEEPKAGVWEIVVAGALENSLGNDPEAKVGLRIETDWTRPDEEPQRLNYFVGNLTRALNANEEQWLALSVRDASFRPLNDITVEIEGELFEIVDGRVRVRADRRRLASIEDGRIDIRF